MLVAGLGIVASGGEGHTAQGPGPYLIASKPVPVSGQYADVTATTAICPKGTVAVGGGFGTSVPSPGSQWIAVYESQRVGSREWHVSGVQMFTGSGLLTAFANCERVNGKVKPRASTIALGAPASTVTGFAACPRGSKVVGGGFSVPPATPGNSTLISRSILGNGVGWVVDASRLEGTATGSLTAIAYCADVGKIKTKSASAAILGSSGSSQTAATPVCPRKTSLRGGGFASSTPVNGILGSALVYESRPQRGGGTPSWVSSAVPGGAQTKSTLVSNGYCR